MIKKTTEKNMKKIILLLAITSTAYANYTVKLPLETTSGGHLPENTINIGNNNTIPEVPSPENWIDVAPIYTEWTDVDILYNCSNWTPSSTTKTASETFNQTATNCRTDQSRTRQDMEQETTTLEYRNKGNPVTENNTLTNQNANRSYTVTLGSWLNDGALYGCSNWTPDPSTVNNGVSFVQTANNCQQNQIRSRVESYIDHRTSNVVQSLNASESNILLNQTSTRNSTGTKVVTKECRAFNGTVFNVVSGWQVYLVGSVSYLHWDGVYLGETYYQNQSFAHGGYTYTLIPESGQDIDEAGVNWGYDICRE